MDRSADLARQARLRERNTRARTQLVFSRRGKTREPCMHDDRRS